MKINFFKSNFYLLLFTSLNFLLSYIFIYIITISTNDEVYFQFTGIITFLNLISLPLNSLGQSLSGLFKNGKVNKKKIQIIFTISLNMTILFIFLFFLISKLSFMKNIILIDEIYIKYLCLVAFLNFLFAFRISFFQGMLDFKKWSLINFLLILFRTLVLVFLFLLLKKNNVTHILFTFIISYLLFSPLYINVFKYYKLKKYFLNFIKLNFNFLRNLSLICLYGLVLNIDVFVARYIDSAASNIYYISALFGKIPFMVSSVLSYYLYPTNVQKVEHNLLKILILNLSIIILSILFYKFFYNIINNILFPNLTLDFNLILYVTIIFGIFSISNTISFKLNASKKNIHLFIKYFALIIFLLLVFSVTDIVIMLKYMFLFSMSYLICDLIILIKYEKNILGRAI